MKEIIYYQTHSGKVPYIEWYSSLDNSLKLIVDKRISKIARGLYGEYKRLSENLYEFKFANGLRIYFSERNNRLILLLMGGNKSKQNKDIKLAQEYIDDFLVRLKE